MRIEVSGQHFNFPPYCACCGFVANTTLMVSATKESGKKVVHTKTNAWQFPYCSRCTAHVQALKTAQTFTTLAAVATVVISLFLMYSVASWFGIFVGILGGAGTVFLHTQFMAQANKLRIPHCACLGPAVAFLDWDGTRQVFEITSHAYALAFMVENSQKLVNVSPQARQLLEANGHGHHANRPQTAQKFRS